jgi:hypothetical protein
MKRKFYYLSLLAGLLFGMAGFTSCSNDDNAVPTQQEVATKIIGKWMFADRDGVPTPTNKKRVFNFVSATKAYVSASYGMDIPGAEWPEQTEATVAINGNVVTLTMHLDEHTTMVDEYNVTAINDTEFTARLKVTITVDGTVKRSTESTIHLTRVAKDFSKDILGTWEGRSSSEESSEYDDGKLHRWDYKADGTFVFYNQDEYGEWQVSKDVFAEYFCDGTLLCTRWKNVGEGQKEKREWWEILSIENGVMKWYGLRQREDGTTYTASYYMTKVK